MLHQCGVVFDTELLEMKLVLPQCVGTGYRRGQLNHSFLYKDWAHKWHDKICGAGTLLRKIVFVFVFEVSFWERYSCATSVDMKLSFQIVVVVPSFLRTYTFRDETSVPLDQDNFLSTELAETHPYSAQSLAHE